jgi:hypothetical protein
VGKRGKGNTGMQIVSKEVKEDFGEQGFEGRRKRRAGGNLGEQWFSLVFRGNQKEVVV